MKRLLLHKEANVLLFWSSVSVSVSPTHTPTQRLRHLSRHGRSTVRLNIETRANPCSLLTTPVIHQDCVFTLLCVLSGCCVCVYKRVSVSPVCVWPQSPKAWPQRARGRCIFVLEPWGTSDGVKGGKERERMGCSFLRVDSGRHMRWGEGGGTMMWTFPRGVLNLGSCT